MPAPLAPMLATLVKTPPAGAGWVYEPKYDGIRVIGAVAGGEAALFSRKGNPKTEQFPEVAEALGALAERRGTSFVVDGEIVALAGEAPGRFQALQSRLHLADRSAVAAKRRDAPVAYVIFDLLLEGDDVLVTDPWHVRRKRLLRLLHPPVPHVIRVSDVLEGDAAETLANARRRGWEGVIAKRRDAPYQPGTRSRDWLKIKVEHQQEFVVGGYTEPRRSREHFGAILLGYYDAAEKLIYAGHTGGGFSREALRDMHRRLAPLERKTPPFAGGAPKTNEKAHWVRPSVVVEVRFNEWTADGKLRQPIFLGVRDDKKPRDVVREETGPPASPSIVEQLETCRAQGGGTLDFGGAGTLAVSRLDKVFFPTTGHTKGDVMRYYAGVANYLLPAIADRPLVMKRFPNGVRGESFYQQKAPADAPAVVRVEPVSDEQLKTQARLIGGDLPTLLYLVQLGAISIEPWHSRVPTIGFADYAIIDLDPGPRAKFARVVQVARWVKEELDELGLHGVLKTSGATGLHVVLPLPAGITYALARTLAEVVATRVAEKHPREATVHRWVKQRPTSAVYVDYLQNMRGKTLASVYSVRAQPEPSVSTPLRWDELTEDLSPREFTIDTLPARLASVGDLWSAGMRRTNTFDKLPADGFAA